MGTKIKKIFPLHISTMTAARHHVNLLYITADISLRIGERLEQTGIETIL